MTSDRRPYESGALEQYEGYHRAETLDWALRRYYSEAPTVVRQLIARLGVHTGSAGRPPRPETHLLRARKYGMAVNKADVSR
jgi:hypothetical protein